MSKKAYLITFGSFIVGVLLGTGGTYLFGMAYWGKQTADGLALIKEVEVSQYGERAFAAYEHESP